MQVILKRKSDNYRPFRILTVFTKCFRTIIAQHMDISKYSVNDMLCE